jgi:hypothetical protein
MSKFLPTTWLWELQCLSKRWETFNNRRGLFLKTKVHVYITFQPRKTNDKRGKCYMFLCLYVCVCVCVCVCARVFLLQKAFFGLPHFWCLNASKHSLPIRLCADVYNLNRNLTCVNIQGISYCFKHIVNFSESIRTILIKWDFTFSRRRVWRWLSSGMLRREIALMMEAASTSEMSLNF